MLSTHRVLLISGPLGTGRPRAGGLAACADMRGQERGDRAGNQAGPRVSKESRAETGQSRLRPQGCFLMGLKAALEAMGRRHQPQWTGTAGLPGFPGLTLTSFQPLLHGAFSPALVYEGFPGGSDSKGSVCSAGDPGSITGLGRYPGEEKGNPRQYSCLGNPMDRGAWRATVHGVPTSDTTE